MAIDLKKLTTGPGDDGPVILIMGRAGRGKTSLAAAFPRAVVLSFEKAAPVGVTAPVTPRITDFATAKEWLNEVAISDQFDTIVLDGLEVLEGLITADVCREHNWQSIEQPGYGKGYVTVAEAFRKFMNGLRSVAENNKKAVVLVGHAVVGTFTDPLAGSHSTLDLSMDKRCRQIAYDLSDAILVLDFSYNLTSTDTRNPNAPKRAQSTGTVIAYTGGSPASPAKNRYGMEQQLVIPQEDGFSALVPYLANWSPSTQPTQA